MDFLIDTHVLIWTGLGSARLKAPVREAMTAPGNRLFVSAVTAWEFTDLRHRGRLPQVAEFAVIEDALSLQLLDFPASLWRLASLLPNLHGDPVDRMLIAHALQTDLTLITADATIRRYPVRTLW